jgi:hypothetical protein
MGELITHADLREVTGTSTVALWKRQQNGTGPKGLRFSRCVTLFPLDGVLDWVATELVSRRCRWLKNLAGGVA